MTILDMSRLNADHRLPGSLPGGGKLATLREAAACITKLPKSEHDAEEWQAAMHCLLHAADSGGPAVFARIGFMRAINRHVVRTFDPPRKDPHWGRRKLKRDM